MCVNVLSKLVETGLFILRLALLFLQNESLLCWKSPLPRAYFSEIGSTHLFGLRSLFRAFDPSDNTIENIWPVKAHDIFRKSTAALGMQAERLTPVNATRLSARIPHARPRIMSI